MSAFAIHDEFRFNDVSTHEGHLYPIPTHLTLILLFTTTPTFANSVDPDQMASQEAIWSGSTLFVIQFVNLNKNIRWCNLIGG